MKRPQFSLRLMLLVVALLATIFAYWGVQYRLDRTNQSLYRANLEMGLFYAERNRVFWESALQDDDPAARQHAAVMLKEANQSASWIKNMIEKNKN